MSKFAKLTADQVFWLNVPFWTILEQTLLELLAQNLAEHVREIIQETNLNGIF